LKNKKQHKKATQNLLFSKEMVLSMPQSTAYALFQSQTELRKRMAKKEEKFIELLSFLMQKMTEQNAKTNNQTYLPTSERSVAT